MSCSTNNCCIEFYPENGVEYKVDYINLSLGYNANETLSILYYSLQTANQFLKGGGNRINKIGYFDVDVNKNYFTDGTLTAEPAKLYNYDYSLPSNLNKSSGSLVYLKPDFNYQRSITYATGCQGAETPIYGTNYYHTYTSENIFAGLKTHGSEVGYKNVKVTEGNNGATEFTYYSPVDFPENIEVNTSFQHIPSKNIDYKRGLLINEKHVNYIGQTIAESLFDYDFINFEEQTGLLLLKSYFDVNYQGSPLINEYNTLKYYYDNNIDISKCYEKVVSSFFGAQIVIVCYFRSSVNFQNVNAINQRNIFIRPVTEAYGWAKLTSKTTKNYFYEGSTQRVVQTDETYTYNPVNKKISEQKVTNSFGEVMKTKYFYLATVDTPTSKNNISTLEKVETYRGSELLSTSKINYVSGMEGTINNSVIYGAKEIEVLIDTIQDPNVKISLNFNSCLIKWTNENNNASFKNVIWNLNPYFKDPINYNYHFESNSPLNGGGDKNLMNAFDIEGNPRSLTAPDIGAYELN